MWKRLRVIYTTTLAAFNSLKYQDSWNFKYGHPTTNGNEHIQIYPYTIITKIYPATAYPV